MVVLHLPHDHSIISDNQVRGARAFGHNQGPRSDSLVHVIRDGVRAARIHPPPRLRVAHVVSERPCHRHNEAQARKGPEEAHQKSLRSKALDKDPSLPCFILDQTQLREQGLR